MRLLRAHQDDVATPPFTIGLPYFLSDVTWQTLRLVRAMIGDKTALPSLSLEIRPHAFSCLPPRPRMPCKPRPVRLPRRGHGAHQPDLVPGRARAGSEAPGRDHAAPGGRPTEEALVQQRAVAGSGLRGGAPDAAV